MNDMPDLDRVAPMPADPDPDPDRRRFSAVTFA